MKKGRAFRNIGFFQYIPSPLYQPCSFKLYNSCTLNPQNTASSCSDNYKGCLICFLLGHFLWIFFEQHRPHYSQELGNCADHFKWLWHAGWREAKGHGASVTADQEEYDWKRKARGRSEIPRQKDFHWKTRRKNHIKAYFWVWTKLGNKTWSCLPNPVSSCLCFVQHALLVHVLKWYWCPGMTFHNLFVTVVRGLSFSHILFWTITPLVSKNCSYYLNKSKILISWIKTQKSSERAFMFRHYAIFQCKNYYCQLCCE